MSTTTIQVKVKPNARQSTLTIRRGASGRTKRVTIRRPLEDSVAALERFMIEHPGWIIEGCYGDLIAAPGHFRSLRRKEARVRSHRFHRGTAIFL